MPESTYLKDQFLLKTLHLLAQDLEGLFNFAYVVMPADDDMIGQTYNLERVSDSMRPIIFLINDRFIHTLPNSNEAVTYQAIIDFITGGYYADSQRTFLIEPRISILRYIVRFIWSKIMEKSIYLTGKDLFSTLGKITNFNTKWAVFLLDQEVTSPGINEAIGMWLDKYLDELRLFSFLLTPIACIISLHRSRNYLFPKKERVCLECFKDPQEKGCPRCDYYLDFFILIKLIITVSCDLLVRCFDKIFSIDLLED